jgi:Mrp family chromosome partitioning ATPase/capsular polysaccharide biosynthesis protein
MEPNLTPQPRLRDYLRPITSRWWLIVIAVVVATGGVYAYYRHKPNVYTASTLVYVTDPGDPVSGVQASPTTDRNVADVASLLDSTETAAAVARRIGYRGSASALLSQVTASSKQGEDFIVITANSGSAHGAAAIANGFAQQFVSTLSDTFRNRVDAAIRTLSAQLSQTTGSGPNGQLERAGVISQLHNLQLLRQVPATVAQHVSPATPPASPSSPKPTRNAIFALLISLVGAIAVCYGFERFDRRLKTPEDFESAFAFPVLGVLPHSDDPDPIGPDGAILGSDFREPFRSVRTNIELATVDSPPRTIVVTSAIPGEGKSTVVRNLALAFCEGGKRVVVVDLDLRNPSLRTLLGVPAGTGFTDVLRGGATLDDAIVKVPTSLPRIEQFVSSGRLNEGNGLNGRNGNASNGQESSDLYISFLRTGPRPANPPSVLGSDRAIEVLDELRERFDIVLIDSAPVLAVTDTVPLLRHTDATIFVGRFSVTSRDTVKRLHDFLNRVPDVNLLGVVANELSRMDASSYGYGYGYYGPYGGDGGSAPARPGLRLGGRAREQQKA